MAGMVRRASCCSPSGTLLASARHSSAYSRYSDDFFTTAPMARAQPRATSLLLGFGACCLDEASHSVVLARHGLTKRNSRPVSRASGHSLGVERPDHQGRLHSAADHRRPTPRRPIPRRRLTRFQPLAHENHRSIAGRLGARKLGAGMVGLVRPVEVEEVVSHGPGNAVRSRIVAEHPDADLASCSASITASVLILMARVTYVIASPSLPAYFVRARNSASATYYHGPDFRRRHHPRCSEPRSRARKGRGGQGSPRVCGERRYSAEEVTAAVDELRDELEGHLQPCH
jgi:hypothetical protein